jgi:hypothetical protein
MRKQYILVDTSTSSFNTIHTALLYAQAAQLSGMADIKLVFTPMLIAEKEHSNNVLKRHSKSNPPKYNTSPPSDGMSIYDLLEKYDAYVEIPPASKIETKVIKALAGKLARLDSTNANRLRAALNTDESRQSLLNKDTLLTRLEDPEFFAKAYDICARNRNFRERLKSKNLNADLADKSIAQWYKGLDDSDKTSDVLLLSRDEKLLEYMKNIHDKHHPEAQAYLEHFDHFTMTGFAQHVRSDLTGMEEKAGRMAKTPESDQLLEVLEQCKSLCDWTLANKKGGGSLRYEQAVISRLR